MSYIVAICLALCWGSAFLASKNMVDVLPPWWSTFFRVAAGLLFLAVFYAVQRKNLKCPARQLWRPWTIGFLLILLPFAALSWGQRFVDPTISGIFNGTTPIWSFLAGAVILKGVDRFTWRRAAGVMVGLLGLIVIMSPNLSMARFKASPNVLYGCLALLIMTWSDGFGNVLTKKIMVDSRAVSLEANTFHQYLFSALAVGIIAWLLEPVPALSAFSGKVVVSILVAGVLSSAVAFLLMVFLLKRWGATRMSSVTYFSPIIAMASDVIFRSRLPQGIELAGLVLIFISLWLIQKPVKAK